MGGEFSSEVGLTKRLNVAKVFPSQTKAVSIVKR